MELCGANETRALMALGGSRTGDLPALVVAGGPAAQFAWEEFLFGRIRNEHTRRAYGRAVGRFLGWCEGWGLDLPRIAPRDVEVYLDLLPGSTPTKKRHLAALRHFFDQLVSRHAVILNPAASVRAQRYQVVEGKTPEISVPHRSTPRHWRSSQKLTTNNAPPLLGSSAGKGPFFP